MYYEINISLNGQHYFATAERSLTNKKKTQEVFDKLKASFPESEGYKLCVSHWKKVGQRVTSEFEGT